MSSSLEPDGTDESGLTGFERSLGSVKPASHGNRDRILFLAGQQHAIATKRPHWSARPFWPALAASLAIVSIAQGILLTRRPSPEIRMVYVQVPHQQQAMAKMPVPASSRRIAAPSREDFDLQSMSTLDRRQSLMLHDDLGAMPNSPVIALAPADKPLTAAQGLRIHVQESADLGDSL